MCVKLIVGRSYKFKRHRKNTSLQLRRVAEKGFNFCDEYNQKVFKNNFYCPFYVGEENPVPDDIMGKQLPFQVHETIALSLDGDFFYSLPLIVQMG